MRSVSISTASVALLFVGLRTRAMTLSISDMA